MTRRPLAVALALVCALATTSAHARHQKHQSLNAGHQVTQFCGDRVCAGATIVAGKAMRTAGKRRTRLDPNGNVTRRAASHGYVTIATAAGIAVTVAPQFAAPIAGFITDLVARGYTPKKIHCLNYSRSHVPGSLHFRGLACDFDQRGWGKTASAMYRVADLAQKWGLRDGGEFRDWGHIDMGPHLRRARSNLYAAVDDYQRRHARR